MNLSQSKFINNVISDAVSQGLDDNRIRNNVNIACTFLYHHYAILVLTLGAVSAFAVSNLFEVSYLKAINIWCLVTLILIILFFSTSYRFAQKDKLPIKQVTTYLFGVTTVMGLCISAGSFIVMSSAGLPTANFEHAHISYFAFMLIMLLVVLVSMSNLMSFVFLYIATSSLGLLFLLFEESDVLYHEPFFYLYAGSFMLVYALATFELTRVRGLATAIGIDAWKAQKGYEQQKTLSFQHENTIIAESEARQAVEHELNQTKQHFERNVLERTKHISGINENLMSAKRSLDVAHEAAGLASWNWDVNAQILSGTNFDVLLDYKKEEMPALLNNFYTMVHPEDEDDLKHEVKRFLFDIQTKLHATFRLKTQQGDWIWVDCMGLTLSTDDSTKKPKQVVGIIRDITLEKNVTDSLNLSNKVFEQSAESIFVLDANMNVVSVNPSYERSLGYYLEEIEGKPLFLWYDNVIASNTIIQKVMHTLKTTGEYNGEISEKTKDGKKIFLQVSINEVLDDDGKEVINYIGIFSDLTEQRQNQNKLSYLENYDQLTDLPNRAFFNQQLHALLTNDNNEKFAVIRVNIDRFSVLNNHLGSDTADLLLKHISNRLSQVNYSVRTLARIGGDDFAILYNHLSLYDLKKYLTAIADEFTKSFYIAQQEVNVRLSLGVSLYPQHGHQVDTLINRAEKGLKKAKQNGGNTYFIYNQGLHVSPQNLLELENELRYALSNGELVTFFQPKISLKTNTLIGFEALVRWHHPEKGILMPGMFMGVAEETGLINELGVEVLTLACQQLARWEHLGLLNGIKVAVNVEVQQLKRGNFLTILDSALANTRVNPNYLELEITESSIMDMPEKILPLLSEIKKRDITIAMDDFGTGYSSLAYLSQYPIDVIKIDRSFINSLNENEQSKGIVKAVIAMGHSLGMKLVAEGVETAEQIDFLTKEGCHIAQGYYYGKAVPAAQATNILQRQQKI